MKKIFAIALALVMVLSMASAFAAQCVTPNWACAEDVCTLGKGKVEVIPYVKGNGCEDGVVFTANTCAGAVNKDYVYFAVKVTVEENANHEWWQDVTFTFDNKGVGAVSFYGANGTFSTLAQGRLYTELLQLDKKGQDDLIAGEYYVVTDKNGVCDVIKAEDFTAGEKTLMMAAVTNASKAKVCAVLTATNEYDGGKVNGYTVSYNKTAGTTASILAFENDTYKVKVFVDKDAKIVKFEVGNKAWTTVYTVETYNIDGTKFWAGADGELDWTCNEYGKFLKGVMDSFNLAFKTCITHKAVVANFGWDDEIKGCFAWSDKAVSVVDAECVVAIPKTGDASVLAWLF